MDYMKILVTNDDGFHSEGIKSLTKILDENGHEVVVLAPDQEMSACSHSISIHSPLRVRKVRDKSLPEKVYRVNGTPADCIKLGLHLFDNFVPELIISGINNGKNLGYDVFYSGTVAGAVEAYLQGYRSLAVSLAVKKERNFRGAAEIVNNFIEKEKLFNDKNSAPININIPDIPKNEIKGIKITNLTPKIYDRSVEKRMDPEGRNYFWFVGGNQDIEYPDSDIEAVKEGYISVTPLKFDITDKSRKNELSLLEKLDLKF